MPENFPQCSTWNTIRSLNFVARFVWAAASIRCGPQLKRDWLAAQTFEVETIRRAHTPAHITMLFGLCRTRGHRRESLMFHVEHISPHSCRGQVSAGAIVSLTESGVFQNPHQPNSEPNVPRRARHSARRMCSAWNTLQSLAILVRSAVPLKLHRRNILPERYVETALAW